MKSNHATSPFYTREGPSQGAITLAYHVSLQGAAARGTLINDLPLSRTGRVKFMVMGEYSVKPGFNHEVASFELNIVELKWAEPIFRTPIYAYEGVVDEATVLFPYADVETKDLPGRGDHVVGWHSPATRCGWGLKINESAYGLGARSLFENPGRNLAAEVTMPKPKDLDPHRLFAWSMQLRYPPGPELTRALQRFKNQATGD